jgi:hypothetical protein
MDIRAQSKVHSTTITDDETQIARHTATSWEAGVRLSHSKYLLWANAVRTADPGSDNAAPLASGSVPLSWRSVQWAAASKHTKIQNVIHTISDEVQLAVHQAWQRQ